MDKTADDLRRAKALIEDPQDHGGIRPMQCDALRWAGEVAASRLTTLFRVAKIKVHNRAIALAEEDEK